MPLIRQERSLLAVLFLGVPHTKNFNQTTHTTMTQNKQDYVSPITDVLVLRIETGILITSDPKSNPNNGYDPNCDLGDI